MGKITNKSQNNQAICLLVVAKIMIVSVIVRLISKVELEEKYANILQMYAIRLKIAGIIGTAIAASAVL